MLFNALINSLMLAMLHRFEDGRKGGAGCDAFPPEMLLLCMSNFRVTQQRPLARLAELSLQSVGSELAPSLTKFTANLPG